MTAHELWWQDDNGNRVCVASYATRAAAEAARAELEARGHEQPHWIEATGAADGSTPPATGVR